MKMPLSYRRLAGPKSIVCIDVENKPGTYGPDGYTHGKITAVGFQGLDEHKPHSIILDRRDERIMREDAENLRRIFSAYDVELGHNYRRHDKKLLNGLLMGLGLDPLPDKPIIDTYLDLPKRVGVSFSLENCADRFGCPIQKVQMSEYAWERAYDGDPKWLPLERKRVELDVTINIWLYRYFKEKGWLS